MKKSKSFILLALVTALIIAVSACTGTPSQSSGITYNGTTLFATVEEIDGDKITVSIQYNTLGSGGFFAPGLNGSLNYSFATMSVNGPSYTAAQSYEYNFSQMSLSTNVSVYHDITAIMLESFTAPTEMLSGISRGDTVSIKFDENGKITEIKKLSSQVATDDKKSNSPAASSTAAPAQKPAQKPAEK